MEPKAVIHKILLALFVLSFATWGTSCASSTTQQETTSQQKTQQGTTSQQKTQQGTIQRATTAPVSSSTTPSSDRAAQLVGTWEAQSVQDQPLPAGTTANLTFLNDGTLKVSGNANGQGANLTGQYSVLDDSHLQVNINGDSQVWEYSLSGNTLRVTGRVSRRHTRGRGVTSSYAEELEHLRKVQCIGVSHLKYRQPPEFSRSAYSRRNLASNRATYRRSETWQNAFAR